MHLWYAFDVFVSIEARNCSQFWIFCWLEVLVLNLHQNLILICHLSWVFKEALETVTRRYFVDICYMDVNQLINNNYLSILFSYKHISNYFMCIQYSRKSLLFIFTYKRHIFWSYRLTFFPVMTSQHRLIYSNAYLLYYSLVHRIGNLIYYHVEQQTREIPL